MKSCYPFVVLFGSEGRRTHHIFTAPKTCQRFSDHEIKNDPRATALMNQITEARKSETDVWSRMY